MQLINFHTHNFRELQSFVKDTKVKYVLVNVSGFTVHMLRTKLIFRNQVCACHRLMHVPGFKILIH